MAMDTILKVDNEYHDLDRWYVFESEFKHGEKNNANEALYKINIIKKNLINLTEKWDERQNEFMEYYNDWLLIAENIIKNKNPRLVIFYIYEYAPDEYFNKKRNT